MISLLSVTLSLALAQAAGTQSAGQVSRATGEIRGRVTDRASGLPIARALVRLHKMGDGDEMLVRTDELGRYEFTGLTPGEYAGFVEPGNERGMYITTSLTFAEGSARKELIALKAGEVRTDVNVTLERALAIAVRVVNEWGQPLAGIWVTAHPANGADGYSPTMSRSTDDRGSVRLFGIPPGRYFVCATISDVSYSVPKGAARDRLLRTCYPSAASETDAEPVSIERSDVETVDLRMRRGRTFTVSGTVLDASGAAVSSARVMFSQFGRNSSSSGLVPVEADGHFSIANVAPGEYAIEASLGGPDQPEQRRDLERALQPIRVDTSDIDGLVITMAKAVDVVGRVVIEDEGVLPKRPPDHGPIMIAARPAGDQLPFQEGLQMDDADEDGAFVLRGIFGRRILEVANAPHGWYVKSIRYRGEEIVGVPAEFKAQGDPSDLQVILSTRGAVVSGRVLNDRGEPVRNAQIMLLPAEPSRWTLFQLTGTDSSESGEFRVGPLGAGDYLIVALSSSIALRDFDDRAILKQLMEGAERITLGNEEQRMMDLRLVKDR